MNRIPLINAEQAPSEISDLYNTVKGKLGLIPNMVKALGSSEAGLQGYLALGSAVAGGKLPTRVREKIALRVAELNDCYYCLSAHTAIGGMLKVPTGELESARMGNSPDPYEQAVLALVESILETRGDVPDAILENALAAGVGSEQIVEVVTNVALNLFTNYFNRLARTEIDFPQVRPLEIAAA